MDVLLGKAPDEHQVIVLYAASDFRLSSEDFSRHMRLLPDAMQQSILKFRRWQDAQLCLLGKLLLSEGFRLCGHGEHLLENIQYTEYNRPYMAGDIDFNISHSGEVVVCAISKGTRIGIDIERIKEISIRDFTNEFSESEMDDIMDAPNPLSAFYRLWTKKEAIVKADGKGLSIPLKEIIFKDNLAEVGNRSWYLRELDLCEGYCCHVATETNEGEVMKIQYEIFSGH